MKSTRKLSLWSLIKSLFHRAEPAPDTAETIAANRAATATRIDALMALPIKERSAVTLIGDEGVSGYNPPPQRRPDEA
jgi:hypothetical protein